MITLSQLRDAVFWGEEAICLSCGAVGEMPEDGVCAVCGSEELIPPDLGLLIVERMGGEEGGLPMGGWSL